MTRNEITAFRMILRCGSFSAAAEKLYITQPALSRRIRSLEEELGYSLFLRGKGFRRAVLTPEGELFSALARKLEESFREAESIADESERSVLRLASVGSISTYLLPPVLRKFAGEGRRLTFSQVHSYEGYRMVRDRSMDLALITDTQYDPELRTLPLLREPFVVIGATAAGRTGPITPEELDPSKEIRLPWNPEFDLWHDRWYGITARPFVRLDQMSLLEEFLTGDHYAVAPLLVAELLAGGGIPRCALQDGPEDEIIYYLVREGTVPESAQRFLALLDEEIQKHPGVQSFL